MSIDVVAGFEHSRASSRRAGVEFKHDVGDGLEKGCLLQLGGRFRDCSRFHVESLSGDRVIAHWKLEEEVLGQLEDGEDLLCR